MASLFVAICFVSTTIYAEDYPKVGVEVCDKYVKNYVLCLEKIPATVKPSLEMTLKATITGWKTVLANTGTKAVVEQSCQAALTSTKQAFGTYGCTWDQ